MAFDVGDRVQVTDQSSQWRNQYGDVMVVDGQNYDVRLDGMPTLRTARLLEPQLRGTSIPDPIDYDSAS